MTYPVSRDNSQLGSVLQEDISSGLLGTDSDSIVRDNCTRGWWHLEFLGGELEHGREWGRLGHTQPGRKGGTMSQSQRMKHSRRGTYTLKGSFGSEVRVILNVTFEALQCKILVNLDAQRYCTVLNLRHCASNGLSMLDKPQNMYQQNSWNKTQNSWHLTLER